MDEPEREVVYFASMLAWLGCHIDACEQAKWFGDDQAFKHDAAYIDDADADVQTTGRKLEGRGAVCEHCNHERLH